MKTFLILCITFLISATPALAQTNWIKLPGNPVLDLGASGEWDDSRVVPDTVIEDGGIYKLWYTGWDGTTDKNFKVGYATSPDGITWTKHAGNPVLDVGATDEWDDWSVGNPSVIKDDGVYRMWYSGSDGSARQVGYATSPDGITWTKHAGNPVLSQGASGSWDSWGSTWCNVIKDELTYKMWYSGAVNFPYHKIGYATSPDGTTWTKYAGNPVLDVGATDEWDDEAVWFPVVIKEASTYLMWYLGNDGSKGRTGYATSPDGTTWTKYAGNPVLDVGATDEWDDEGAGIRSVLKEEVVYKAWYSGRSDGTDGRVGYATSTPENGPCSGVGSAEASVIH